ncbi:MAG: hypothetical protein ACRD8A_17280 [Candidatus Acidiferrales bacterium]
MDLIARVLLVGLVIIAGVLLFTPYEAFLEGAIAVAILVVAVAGFMMHPRRDIFYVRTSARFISPDGTQGVERDFVAVRVDLTRLWLLFVPTFLSVAFLVFFAAGGPTKFSFVNWIFSSENLYVAFMVCQYAPLLVIVLLWAWIAEGRVLRDAEARSARSFSVSGGEYGSRARRIQRVSYLFMGEHGEYYGGDCLYFGLVHPHELATIVFHNARKPELNKIAMGFLFHRLIVLARGVTGISKQTAAAQIALAETTASS